MNANADALLRNPVKIQQVNAITRRQARENNNEEETTKQTEQGN